LQRQQRSSEVVRKGSTDQQNARGRRPRRGGLHWQIDRRKNWLKAGRRQQKVVLKDRGRLPEKKIVRRRGRRTVKKVPDMLIQSSSCEESRAVRMEGGDRRKRPQFRKREKSAGKKKHDRRPAGAGCLWNDSRKDLG